MTTAGQRAYEAHAMYMAAHPPSLEHGWRAPPWAELADNAKTAWERAATAARKTVRIQPNPMQPLVIEKGIIRFKRNALVRYLLDAGPFDMNHLALLPGISKDDEMQFAQLIGYSVSGYGDLPYVSDASYNAANEAAEELRKELRK